MTKDKPFTTAPGNIVAFVHDDADAEFIVRSCNAHDDLVAALETSAELFCAACCPSVFTTAGGPKHIPACLANHAALSKAGGK